MFSNAILSPGLFLGMLAFCLWEALFTASGVSVLSSEYVEDSSLLLFSSLFSSRISSALIDRDLKGSVSLSHKPLPGGSVSLALCEMWLGGSLTSAGAANPKGPHPVQVFPG